MAIRDLAPRVSTREALQDARDCAAFDAYVFALLVAPAEALSAAQRRQRVEVELVTLRDPEVEAAIERLRPGRQRPGGTRDDVRPAPVNTSHRGRTSRRADLTGAAGGIHLRQSPAPPCWARPA
ncbi:hypothetical protein CcI49_22340 [Frankia sp. CcI49]|uniref:hypothetical protein n=1 Tax=unclassified Frankia TaxID=2632575 RepID=UPI0006C9FE99|nr:MULTISPECIES: hypothetical protein [unclassified Frankia]KPM55903.1 hypothetical protein ACG83_11760 [Frankia sp. R43]ONH58233.1 hypothetical protein CcI49_22340 [Frankia sp. CcI49]